MDYSFTSVGFIIVINTPFTFRDVADFFSDLFTQNKFIDCLLGLSRIANAFIEIIDIIEDLLG